MHILVPSIVDPTNFPGGAGAATRGILDMLSAPPLQAHVHVMPSGVATSGWRNSVRRAYSLLRSIGSPLPAKALYQLPLDFRRKIQAALKTEDYDLLLINSADLLWAVDLVPEHLPILVVAHNVEYELYADQQRRLRLPRLFRPLLRSDLAKMKSFELENMNRVDGVIFLSSHDADTLAPYLEKPKLCCVPPVFSSSPPQRRQPAPSSELLRLGFLANLNWWPNREALAWFVEQVLPHCHDRVQIHLFGVGSHRAAKGPRQVIGHGYVPNLSVVWSTSDLIIVPHQMGGGVNIKLAEAYYNGVPVLATAFSIRGLPVQPGPTLAIRETPEEWIDFLQNTSPEKLAAATIPEELRMQFSASTHRKKLESYIEGIVSTHEVERV